MMESYSQSGIATVAVVLIVALGVLVAGGGVVAASDSAKPGDVLYPIDTAVENVRLGLTNNPIKEAGLRTDLATERVLEASQVLAETGAVTPELEIALANLMEQRQAIATIVAATAELKAQRQVLEAAFQQQDKELQLAFEAAKTILEGQTEQLTTQSKAATKAGDTTQVQALKQQVDSLKNQIEALEEKEDEVEEEAEEVELPEPEESPEPLEPEEEEEQEAAEESEED